MEELQDAIEDAQYVNAIATQEDGPRPVLAWETPSPEELEIWEKKKLATNTKAFELETLLESPIALYLFSTYIKTHHKDYMRINFCEDVIRYKKASGETKLKMGHRLATRYLHKTETTKPPSETDIHECDLARKVPSAGSSDLLKDVTLSEAMDYPVCSECFVGLKGKVRDEVYRQWAKQERNERSRKMDTPSSSFIAEDGVRLEELEVRNEEESETTDKDKLMEDDDEPEEITAEKSMDKTADMTAEKSTDNPAESARNGSDASGIRSSEASIITTESMRSLTKRFKGEQTTLRNDVFDLAETIVFESLKEEYWELFQQSEEHVKLKNFLWYGDRRVVPEDFYTMRVLGRGGFGLVTACKKGTSGKLYAMKVMNKRRIKMKKSEQLVWNERHALAAVESNFVVNLKYSFHSKDDIYLILDLMTGGDLGFHLHQKGRFPKRETQYYASRIILALQALHDKNYVYRDLKPENCLLADDGRVKITDLGLATRITPTLHGAAGTRGYWAPEMLRRDRNGKRMPYGHAVDWFSFGCCLAEFISGINPFRSEAAYNFGLGRGKQTKEKAIDCATLEMDPEFTSEAFDDDSIDLCRRLLDKNEKTRIGAGGCEEIMAHPYFKNVNWESIITDKKKPPFVPAKDVNAASQSEIGTFQEDKAYQETVLSPADERVYNGWDWLNPHAYATEVIEFLMYERETGEPLLPITQNATCCCTVL